MVKDYDAIMLFGLGLVLAIVAYLLFIIHRRDATLRNKPWFKIVNPARRCRQPEPAGRHISPGLRLMHEAFWCGLSEWPDRMYEIEMVVELRVDATSEQDKILESVVA